MERDSRGAWAALVVGALMVAAVTGYAVTEMDHQFAPLATPFWAVGLVLIVGALLRQRRGRATFDPDRLMELHRQQEQRFGANMLRIVGFMLDVGLCAFVCFVVVVSLDEVLPRNGRWDWKFDHSSYLAGSHKGMAYWRAAWSQIGTSEAQEIAGPFCVGFIISGFLLLPSMVWGGTPFMLAFRIKHLRTDGRRTGVVHAFLRTLGGLLFAPLQVAAVLLTLVFGSGGRFRTAGGGIAYGRHRIRELAHARRSISDLICRTETLRLPKGWGRT